MGVGNMHNTTKANWKTKTIITRFLFSVELICRLEINVFLMFLSKLTDGLKVIEVNRFSTQDVRFCLDG